MYKCANFFQKQLRQQNLLSLSGHNALFSNKINQREEKFKHKSSFYILN